jgi:hypothetical protein
MGTGVKSHLIQWLVRVLPLFVDPAKAAVMISFLLAACIVGQKHQMVKQVILRNSQQEGEIIVISSLLIQGTMNRTICV